MGLCWPSSERASARPRITDHDGEFELADYFIDELREAGWGIEDF